ncbi:MotE family protein [Litorimonas haliclonae]|uniref:MotE family protein n=1 Tax=Litorimonas haliclonae TaxID=2081977 RepID=UPI0039EEC7E4
MTKKVLPIIAVSFGVIFLIQAGNLSLASADVKTDIAKPKSTTSDTQISAEEGNIESESVCLTGAVAETLMNERSALNSRQIEIAKRETALKALETKVQKDVDSLEVTQKTIQNQIDKMEKVAEDDILHLVEMYKTMKPKKAAEIFDSMDPGFAAGFLRQMDSTQAGLIMSEMSARKSYQISLIIANRGADWRQ